MHQVLQLPAWELSVWEVRLAHEPFVAERQEAQLAYLAQIVLSRWRKEGSQAPGIHDCLLYANAWGEQQDAGGDGDVPSMIAQLKRVFPNMRERAPMLDVPEKEE